MNRPAERRTLRPVSRCPRWVDRLGTLGVALLGVAPGGGCARTYHAVDPPRVTSETLNAVVHQVWFILGKLAVRVQTGARDGMRLRDAKLSAAGAAGCAEGTPFESIELDGVPIVHGPLDLSGQHDLEISFPGPAWVDRSSGPIALDLELAAAGGPMTCVRVPLWQTPSAPVYALDDDSAGLAVEVAGHGYPLPAAKSASASAVVPEASFEERLGVSFGRYRVSGEFGAAVAHTENRGDLVAAFAADEALWQKGRWGARLGLGYELVWPFEKASQGRPPVFHELMQGPRVTPALSFSLMPTLPGLRMPAGWRTIDVELDLPISVWFGGSADIPKPLVVPGLGLTFFASL